MTTYRLSAGIIIIHHTDAGCRYLLLRAYNYWDFPKGEVESGETPISAAQRETMEETGIQQLEFRWRDVYYETPAYASGKIARYYVAETRQTAVTLGFNPELGQPEHHEYRWVSYSEGYTLLNDRVRAALNWAQQLSGCGNEN